MQRGGEAKRRVFKGDCGAKVGLVWIAAAFLHSVGMIARRQVDAAADRTLPLSRESMLHRPGDSTAQQHAASPTHAASAADPAHHAHAHADRIAHAYADRIAHAYACRAGGSDQVLHLRWGPTDSET